MTNQAWVPEIGGKAIVINEPGYTIAYGESAIGKEVEVKALFKSGDIDVAAVEHQGSCYCFRADMLTAPVSDEDRAVEEMLKSMRGMDFFREGPVGVMRKLYRDGYSKQPQCRCHADEVETTVPYTRFFSIGKGDRVYLGAAGSVTITHVERHELNEQSYPSIVKAEAEKNGKHLLIQYIYAGNGDYVVDVKPLPDK